MLRMTHPLSIRVLPGEVLPSEKHGVPAVVEAWHGRWLEVQTVIESVGDNVVRRHKRVDTTVVSVTQTPDQADPDARVARLRSRIRS